MATEGRGGGARRSVDEKGLRTAARQDRRAVAHSRAVSGGVLEPEESVPQSRGQLRGLIWFEGGAQTQCALRRATGDAWLQPS